jgi:hypothetical protein
MISIRKKTDNGPIAAPNVPPIPCKERIRTYFDE